jgi:hypothetical protein
MPLNEVLTEDDIALELKRYRAFSEAWRAGKRGEDLPNIPENRDCQRSNIVGLVGTILHLLVWIAIGLAQLLRVHAVTAALSELRIKTDHLSFEPRSCGLNAAYTTLGLARLAMKDLVGAIHSLDWSWRVHPCPHNSSYGLKRKLALALSRYPEAESTVRDYVRIGKKFAIWPDHWAAPIEEMKRA